MKKSARTPESIVLEYSLLDLPTAQHKAGLAGLLLHIECLQKRRGGKPIPEILNMTRYGAAIRFTLPQLQTLLDDLYDAAWVEDEAKSKRPGKPPKRVKEVMVSDNGKERKEKRFIYDRCAPAGHVLQFYFGTADSPWIKLWRDMLWNVLRAQPTTRGDYERRANRKPLLLAAEFWSDLAKANEKRKKGEFETGAIASSVFVGAQARNAERVPFLGRIEHNFLLNFWQWATPIYVPRVIKAHADRPEHLGFLLAIPEVGDLEFFVELGRHFWRSLDSRMAGYLPAQSLIDLPEEGPLDFLYQLAQCKLRKQDIGDAVHAVEFYHLERQGNNVRMLASQRVLPETNVLAEYARVRGYLHNPLFKSLRIRNLLAARAWYEGAESLFSAYPVDNFVWSSDSRRFDFFGVDARAHFRSLISDLDKTEELPMREAEPAGTSQEDGLARRIYRLIGTYVRHRTRDKTGKDDSDFPKNAKGYPVYSREYLDAREKVAKDAFLAMRARRDADFIEYFTGSVCAVPHFLPEEEFFAVSRALAENPASVKNLSMIALSAHSWSPNPKADTHKDMD